MAGEKRARISYRESQRSRVLETKLDPVRGQNFRGRSPASQENFSSRFFNKQTVAGQTLAAAANGY